MSKTRFVGWATLSCVAGLLSGCVTTDSYCTIAAPMYFGSSDTIAWLAENDTALLTDIVVHNEQRESLCY